ncbi:MAG: primosomal protein N' [Rhodospirillaceae bacterium]|nr:primosomal protein N' [Rhodospirillaceae bacterium]
MAKNSNHNPLGALGPQISVLVPVTFATGDSAGFYDYLPPKKGGALIPGDVVRVPFGGRSLVGVVWGPGQGGVDKAKLKTITEKIDITPLSDDVRAFIEWVARYNMASPGAVLKMVFNVPGALEKAKPQRGLVLAQGVEPSVRMTPARKRALDFMQGKPAMLVAEIAREAGCTASVISGLFKAGALKEVAMTTEHKWSVPDYKLPRAKLSSAQKNGATEICARINDNDDKGNSVTLIDGVPGSGKTEVYFEAIAKTLEMGKQVLVLLPEIALTAQWLQRFSARFGAQPALWHSDLGDAKRRETWRACSTGKVRVVAGARSALFLPLHEIGLIIVDEEHETAFKQEENVIYNARDMAVVRAHLGKFPIILVSATPSLESMSNTKSGKYHLVHLPERHGGASLPDVELVDMRAQKLPATRWLSDGLLGNLKKVFDAGEQAMLFLNRRGYAPLTLCRACGHRLKCPNCSAWLVEHQTGRRLQCHHCGHTDSMPENCPNCDAQHKFAPIGPGVERLAEEVKEHFPEIRVALASSDTLSGPAKAADLVKRIENHEVDLIIGTQVVAKGYHFPLLTLVGVVDGDLGLAGGDLRAAERTYQLLYQVAGRAGREQKQTQKPGKVVVQTYMPDHPVMQAIKAGSREKFVKAETEARQAMAMPPFGKLVALIISGPDERGVDDAANRLARCAPNIDGVQVLGPAPAPLALLRGKHRRRFLLKLKSNILPQPIVGEWLAKAGMNKSVPKGRHKGLQSVRVQIDIDPQSFM